MDTSLPTPSELLHSFLDGEPLDTSLESSLFESLHTNAELRTEMRDLLALTRAVREDKVALVPPIASTAAVFGALGMSTSMLVQSGWLSSLWSKVWIPLAAGIVSSAVTWYAVSPSSSAATAPNPATPSTAQSSMSNTAPGTISGTGSNETQQTNSDPGSAQHSSSASAIGNQHASSSAYGSASLRHDTIWRERVVYRDRAPALKASTADASSPAERVREVIKYVPVVDVPSDPGSLRGADKNNVAEGGVQQGNNSLHDTKTVSNPYMKPADIVSTEPSVASSFAALSLRKVNPENLKIGLVDAVNASPSPEISLYEAPLFKPTSGAYIRALGGSSLVSVTVPSDNSSAINNLAVGFKRSFNEYFSAGIEIGSENIAMKFNGVVDGTVKRYEANPALTWAGVFAQINVFPSMWNSTWQPFVQLNLAGTNYGFLPKAMLGASISPTPGLRMIIGAEASTLLYSVQSSSYNTVKLGYTYGIGYQF